MFLTVDTAITIAARRDVVWDYAAHPENWTASNPEEHFGLSYDSADNMPGQGVTFHQKESVAGRFADLRGRFHYFDRPNLAFWSGTASYRVLGGILRLHLHEGGVLKIVETAEGSLLSHNVYIEFRDTALGRAIRWIFEHRLNGRQAVFDHAYKELVHFKRKCERLEAATPRGWPAALAAQ